MKDSPMTRDLRRGARARGIRVTEGLVVGGRRINRDDTTTPWCADGEHCVTFEEDDDGLFCADPLTSDEALMLFELAAGRRRDGSDA